MCGVWVEGNQLRNMAERLRREEQDLGQTGESRAQKNSSTVRSPQSTPLIAAQNIEIAWLTLGAMAWGPAAHSTFSVFKVSSLRKPHCSDT